MRADEGCRDDVVITPDGWAVTDLPWFRLLVDHPPPRPYGYLDQLKQDVRDWKCVGLWLLGIGLVALALAAGWWLLLPVGFCVLYFMCRLTNSMRRYCRDTPLCRGVIDALERPHSVWRDQSMARARLADGEEALVSLPTRLVLGMLEEQGRAEVMFLYDPTAPHSVVIGARAIARA